MSKLEELIKEFCPNGVEYKPLWSLTAWDKRFNGIDRSMQKKVVSYKYYLSSEFNEVERKDGDILYIPTGITNEKKYTTEELAGEYLAEGEIVCIPWGGTPNVKYHKGKFVTGDNRIATSLDTNILDNKYLYYWMQSKIDLIASFYRGAGIQHPSMKSVLELQIPLPALPVQREIVRILDSFTLYSAELTAELTARRKQYEFYRDKLLNFNTSMEETTIGDIALVTKLAGFEFTNYVKYSDFGNVIALRGLNVKNGKLDLTDVKYIDGSDFSKLNRSKLQIGDMLFTYVGTIGQVALIEEDDKYYLAPNVALIRLKRKDIMPKYIRYYFQSNAFFSTQILRLLQSSSMQNIPMEKIRKFVVKIPPLEVQKRIVKVLDNFDAICSDLGIGLPAEIEKRQKQYEYYRDKLLTFEGKNNNGEK